MKRINDNKLHPLKPKQQISSTRKDESICFQKLNPLGGVYLYNQKYKRYLVNNLCPDDNEENFQPEKRNQRTSFNRNSQIYEEKQQIQLLTNDFMNRSQRIEGQSTINFTKQIEAIIQQFKFSQINTVMFLEQIRKSNTINENQNQISFDELFEFYKSQRGKQYSEIISKIYKQCKDKMNKEIERLKNEEILKMKKKHDNLKDFSTQTYNDHYEIQSLSSLRKQLLKKEAEYNALYDYKIKLLNDCQQINKHNEGTIKEQKQRIKKLQSQSVSHQYEIKSLQKQLKQLQGRLIAKIADLQRESTINKSEMSSLNQIDQANIEDTVNKFILLRSQIQKKKRYKHRAESLFIATKSLLGTHQDELFASLNDISPQSMQEMAEQFAKQLQEIDQKEEGEKSIYHGRRNSMQRASLLKILQKYLHKKEKKKNSLLKDNSYSKTNSQTPLKSILSRKSMKRNTSLAKSNFDLQPADQINIQQTLEMLFKKKKKEVLKNGSRRQRKSQIIKVGKNINFEDEAREIYKIRRAKKSIDLYKQSHYAVANTKQLSNQNPITIEGVEHLNHSFTQKSDNLQKHINQNRSEQVTKREKKIVNFQLKSCQEQNLRINSRQVSICIPGRNQNDKTHSLMRSSISADKLNQKLFQGVNFQKDQHQVHRQPLENKKYNKITSAIEPKPMQDFQFQPGQNDDYMRDSWGQQRIIRQGRANKQRKSHNEVSMKKKQNWASILQDKNDVMAFREDTSKFSESQYLQKAKIAASLCKNREQYLIELKKMHKGCGPNCSHVKKYFESFDRFKGVRKEIMKVRVQNLNKNIPQSCGNHLSKNN